MSRAGAVDLAITRESVIKRSVRVRQLEGIFDVQPAERDKLSWRVQLPLHERDWNIGLIVGPSGCGKSTIAREAFGASYVDGFTWREGVSLLDEFPSTMSIKDITALLSSVGFSSPPSWVRPFHVLSTGEQFRTTLARAIAEAGELCVFDEFTSVVDRQVARIGSAAIAKTVRRSGKRFIAVTCHDDVEEWLDPDWTYSPATNTFAWRSLRGRPPITLRICRVPHQTWSMFAKHHYLTANLNKAAFCFCAFIDDVPVAFDSWLPFFGKTLNNQKGRRGHRTVCLPDYQGIGIGNALVNRLASMWAGLDLRVFSGTGHPAEIASRVRSGVWRMTAAPRMTARGNHTIDSARASNRLMASFLFVGKPMERALAAQQLNAWAMTKGSDA